MNSTIKLWQEIIGSLPLIAILRGLDPEHAVATANALVDEGFKIIEVPLNSPNAIKSIAKIAEAHPDVIVGAGTVLQKTAVGLCIDAGARLIVTPNLDEAVAKAVPKEKVIYCPGVCTPSEAFSALTLGADLLKLFPAEVITPQAVRALRSVLPTKTLLAPVGGITSSNIPEYILAGADAFGIGSTLYTPTRSLSEIRKNARALISAFLLSKR